MKSPTTKGRRSGGRLLAFPALSARDGGKHDDDAAGLSLEELRVVDGIVAHLQRSGACDLRGHRRTTTARLIHRRVARLGLRGLDEYLAHLEANAVEADLVGHELLVNVTTFFRDPSMWSRLGRVVDTQVEGKALQRPFRVWSAGCASGEEAYSLAILCSEIFGRARCAELVKIYATDVDPSSIERARRGTFSSLAVDGVPAELRASYFQRTGCAGRFEFDPELRRVLVFGRHDLANDPPLSQIDLVLCRNMLMFFRREVQRRLLRRLWFSLRPTGVLLVGASELVAGGPLFTADEQTPQLLRPVAAGGGRRRFAGPSEAVPLSEPKRFELALYKAALEELMPELRSS